MEDCGLKANIDVIDIETDSDASPKSMSATEFIEYTFNEYNSSSPFYLFKRIADILKELGWKKEQVVLRIKL